jgi:hypothetical protein
MALSPKLRAEADQQLKKIDAELTELEASNPSPESWQAKYLVQLRKHKALWQRFVEHVG